MTGSLFGATAALTHRRLLFLVYMICNLFRKLSEGGGTSMVVMQIIKNVEEAPEIALGSGYVSGPIE